MMIFAFERDMHSQIQESECWVDLYPIYKHILIELKKTANCEMGVYEGVVEFCFMLHFWIGV